MPKSVMDHLVARADWRCTKCDAPLRAGCPCWDRVSPAEKQRAAAAVRLHVREHIRTMYPAVWQALTPSQRTRIFHCLYQAVQAALGELHPRVADWPGDADG
jgi:hypothetical protein